MPEDREIKITIERQDRLQAIVNLSSAIEKVAIALSTPVNVNISNCIINNSDTGISVDVSELEQEERTV